MPSAYESPSSCGAVVCRHLGWPKEQFVERAFWRCLPWPARPFALLFWPWRDKVFARDFDALQDVFHATTTPEINAAANSLRHDPRYEPGFIRDSLGIRVSGRRLTALVQSARQGSTASGASRE